MYIYGGSVLSIITFIGGLATSGSIDAAIDVVIDFYIMKLFPWPLNEAIVAENLIEMLISHGITIGVGTIVSTSKWVKNS